MNSKFEIVRPNPAPHRVRVALFDFDGTLSLLRAGWQQVLVDLICDVAPPHNGESAAELRAVATELIHRTNGLPTLTQMQELARLVQARQGAALESAQYKQIFLERLERRVRPRVEALATHRTPAAQWLVPGARQILEALRARGIVCYIASGTDESAVRPEVKILGLEHYFAGIYGARPDIANSTKTAIVQRLVAQHHLQPYELAAFGDGGEEIRVAKRAGGLAVGIARADDGGARDPAQRARLIDAGADVIVADFRACEKIMQYLFADHTSCDL